VRVPSVREVLRKSIIERARRCFVVAILTVGEGSRYLSWGGRGREGDELFGVGCGVSGAKEEKRLFLPGRLTSFATSPRHSFH
jgi:hypothetical protein